MTTSESDTLARHGVTVMITLVITSVVAPLLVVVVPHRSPGPFVAALLLNLAVVGYVLWSVVSRLRSGRRSHRRDYVLATVPLVGALVSLGTVRLGAADYGIAGSALARVSTGIRNGVPLATDLSYLAAVAAIIAVLLSSVVLIAVLVRHRLVGGLAEARDAAAAVAEAATTPPPERRGLVPVTHEADGTWRRLVSPSVWLVFVLNALIAGPVLWVLAADPEGDLDLLGFLFIFPGVPIAAWATLQTAWRPDEKLGYVYAALARGAVVPVVTVPPLAVLHTVLTALPVFVARVEQYQRPDAYIRHYWFSGESGAINVVDGSVFATLALSILGGFAFSLLATLLITVFVVWPVTAVRNPTALLAESKLSQKPEHVAAGVAAVRSMAAVAVLAFVIPFLMVPTDSDEALWWVGAALIPVLVGSVYLARRYQQLSHGGHDTGPDTPTDASRQVTRE